jgi:hypothetical protein
LIDTCLGSSFVYRGQSADTVASGAGGDISLIAGNDLYVSAVSDYAVSRSQRCGANVSLGGSAAGPTVTVGFDWSRSASQSINFTNAQVNAGGDLIVSTNYGDMISIAELTP